MMKRYLLYSSWLCFLCLVGSSCADTASTPPQSTVTVDKTSGLKGKTTFTFTITQAGSNSIVLLPEGVAKTGIAGIIIDPASFTNGKTTVTYQYPDVGVFAPVVVTTNYTGDGKSIKRTVSPALSVTITSYERKILDFTFDKATSTKILDKDTTNSDTINVVVPFAPFGAAGGITALKAIFDASLSNTSPNNTVSDPVTVGGVAQVSGTTANDFSSPVSYTVTSANGTTSTYIVNVTVTPASTDFTIKAAAGKIVSKGSWNGKSYDAYVDNTNKVITIVLPSNATADLLDSIRFDYTTNNAFATNPIKSDSLFMGQSGLDLTGNSTTVTFTAENGAVGVYKVVARIAPSLTITFPNLNPVVSAANSGFAVGLDVLNGTDLNLVTDFAIPGNPPVTVNGNAFASGGTLNFSDPKKFVLSVTDTGVTYQVTYVVTVTVVN